uniref:J domain-containing protein n=1 Tax=viral metagenome TaxID=1070528 RepID=A0A6C0H6L2_9ZZZZ
MDYYKILNVSPNSSLNEIKKAYRTLSKKYHSDKNPNIESLNIMKNLNQAYETLSDPDLKQNYDSSLTNNNIIYSIPNIFSDINLTLEQIYSGILLEHPPIYIKPASNHKDVYFYNNTKYTINILSHPLFKKNDLDLFMEKNITLNEALNGISFTFTHLNGKKYTYEYNKTVIQPETKKIIEGKGFIQGDLIGNLEILFHVILPEK